MSLVDGVKTTFKTIYIAADPNEERPYLILNCKVCSSIKWCTEFINVNKIMRKDPIKFPQYIFYCGKKLTDNFMIAGYLTGVDIDEK
jgi:hypothetical protein